MGTELRMSQCEEIIEFPKVCYFLEIGTLKSDIR